MALSIVKRVAQRPVQLGAHVMLRRVAGRAERTSYMYTDVIIKRGIDTIRICVVPTKTNVKVQALLGL